MQLLNEVAGASFLVDVGGVEVGAEVVVGGVGVGEQVPDDDQDGAGHGDEGFAFASAFDQAAVAFAEERVAAGGGRGGGAEHGLQVGVASGGLPAAAFAAGLSDLGGEVGPGDQVLGGGEPAHVGADLGQDHLGGLQADPGDVGQSL